MARYWCKQCSVFIDDNKLARRHHEGSAKHKSAVMRSISSLHRQNRDDAKEKRDAEIMLRDIQKEIGIESRAIIRPRKPREIKTAKKNDETMNEKRTKEVAISDWEDVKHEEKKKMEDSPIISRHVTKKLSEIDLETRNWNIKEKKLMDASDSDDEVPSQPTFKKRRIKR